MRARLLALLVAVVLIGGAFAIRAAVSGGGSTPASAPSSSGPTTTTRRGAALSLLCPPEAKNLCDQAAAGYAKSPVTVTTINPADVADGLTHKTLSASLWLAPSTYWLTKAGLDPAAAPVVARTPIVIAMWIERADALVATCPIDVSCLHDAVKTGAWVDHGGQPQWGTVKVGHANPTASTDGLLALADIAYAEQGSANSLGGAVGDDPALADYIRIMDGSTPHPAGDVVADMIVKGPAQYDAVLSYESTAVTRANSAKPKGGFRLYYPAATVEADFVIATLDPAARDFAAFLLAPEGQAAVTTAGFRPAAGAPPPGSPIRTVEGAQPDLGAIAPLPSSEALDGLTALWQREVGR